MQPGWASRYVGIPFEEKGRTRAGCDCWGLLRIIYQEELGLELPSYAEDYVTTRDKAEISALIARETRRQGWPEIPRDQAQPGDAILLRMAGSEMHCGIVVEAPEFLHIEAGINAVVEDWSRPHWRHRVVGIYRPQANEVTA